MIMPEIIILIIPFDIVISVINDDHHNFVSDSQKELYFN